MKRLQRIPRKIYLPLLGLVLVLAVGFVYKQFWHKSAKPAEPAVIETKYVSFSGGYLFSIPAGYVANETTIAGVTIAYPESQPMPSGKKLEELYTTGTIAIQPITQLKDDNEQAFKDYVDNTLATDLRKTLNSASDVREVGKGGIYAKEVFALDDSGNRLRVAVAINFPQPVLITAADDSEPFKITITTVEDLKKSTLRPDIDQATQVAKNVADMLHSRDASGVRAKGTTDFNKNVSKDQLVANLSLSAGFLDRSITVVGGSYDGKVFIAQLVFESKTTDKAPVGGVLSLSKQGKNWKLDGFQLPQ